MRLIKIGSLVLLLLSGITMNALAEEIPTPCGGSAALLALVNRPSIADSACVVPFEKGIIEVGAQYQNLEGGKSGYNLPQATLRLGLPVKTELVAIFPNYTRQTVMPHAGWGPTTIGLKHELGHNAKWLGSVEGLVTLSSGSEAFGSDGFGGTINGIIAYKISNALSLTVMLGVSSQTLPYAQRGQRYNSFNPDVVLSWQASEKLQTYGEVYGQSKTSPTSGAGFNADAGVLYLFTPNLETDFVVGQRISGKLGQLNNFFGTGLAWLF